MVKLCSAGRFRVRPVRAVRLHAYRHSLTTLFVLSCCAPHSKLAFRPVSDVCPAQRVAGRLDRSAGSFPADRGLHLAAAYAGAEGAMLAATTAFVSSTVFESPLRPTWLLVLIISASVLALLRHSGRGDQTRLQERFASLTAPTAILQFWIGPSLVGFLISGLPARRLRPHACWPWCGGDERRPRNPTLASASAACSHQRLHVPRDAVGGARR